MAKQTQTPPKCGQTYTGPVTKKVHTCVKDLNHSDKWHNDGKGFKWAY